MQRRRGRRWGSQQQQETELTVAAGQDSSKQSNTARTGSSAEMQLWPIERSSQMTATPSGVESELQADQTSSCEHVIFASHDNRSKKKKKKKKK